MADWKEQKLWDLVVSRLDRLEEKLDSLLQFKWQIIGGTLLVCGLVTLFVNVFFHH